MQKEIEDGQSSGMDANQIHLAGVHPLLLPNVVRHILCHLSSPEVFKCRLVCHQWNAEACAVMPQLPLVTFTSGEAIGRYMDCFPLPVVPAPSADDSPEAEASQPRRLHALLHSAYQMYGLGFHQWNPVLEKFFQAHGAHIKSLSLQQVSLQESQFYRALETYLPNLEALTLRCIPTPWGEEAGVPGGPAFQTIKNVTVGPSRYMHGSASVAQPAFTRLLSRLPALETLAYALLDDGECQTKRIVQSLVPVLEEHGPRKLTRLDFPANLDQQLLEALTAALEVQPANFTVLNLRCEIDVVGAVLGQLLNGASVAPSIEDLSLTFPPNYRHAMHDAPLEGWPTPGREMKRLRRLMLMRYGWELNFLRQMTALESLTCADMSLALLLPPGVKSERVRELKMLRSEIHVPGNPFFHLAPNVPALDGIDMARITRTFPNLCVLHLRGADDACLRVIYMDLPHLTDLACVAGSFTDSGVTGLPLEFCNDLAETRACPGVDACANPLQAVGIRTDLFIGNLTALTNLRLEAPSLTCWAVQFGIVACLGLKYLRLRSDLLTNASVERLVDQLGSKCPSIVRLTVVNCPLVTESSCHFARACFPQLLVLAKDDAQMAEAMEDEDWKRNLAQKRWHAHFDDEARAAQLNVRIDYSGGGRGSSEQ